MWDPSDRSGSCSYAYSWFYDQYEGRRVPPDREGERQLTLTMKLLFLVLHRSEKEWTMPAREWCMAKAQFAVLFGERFARAMA